LLVERVPARRRAGAAAAPVHRSPDAHPAQRLRRHGAVHRVEGAGRARDADTRAATAHAQAASRGTDCCSGHRTERIAQIPREAVEVAEDVAARARRVAVPGGVAPVVEEGPAVAHHRGLGSNHSGTTAVSTAVLGLLALLTIEMSCVNRFIT